MWRRYDPGLRGCNKWSSSPWYSEEVKKKIKDGGSEEEEGRLNSCSISKWNIYEHAWFMSQESFCNWMLSATSITVALQWDQYFILLKTNPRGCAIYKYIYIYTYIFLFFFLARLMPPSLSAPQTQRMITRLLVRLHFNTASRADTLTSPLKLPFRRFPPPQTIK